MIREKSSEFSKDTANNFSPSPLIDTSFPTDYFPEYCGAGKNTRFPGSREQDTEIKKDTEADHVAEATHDRESAKDYNKLSEGAEGAPLKVGPYELTPGQIKNWQRSTSKEDLEQMVKDGRLQKSTAVMLTEHRHHQTVLEMLQCGQTITPDLLQRFVPADLQRAVKEFVDKR